MVIGSEVTFHDVDVTTFGYEQGQMAGIDFDGFVHLSSSHSADLLLKLIGSI